MTCSRNSTPAQGDNSLAPPWLMNCLIIGVGAIVLGILSYGFYTGDRKSRKYAPLVVAAMQIKQEATIAHLWFEEIMSGDRHEDVNLVWKHQDQAEWYARAMVEGGESAEGIILPLDDAEMRRSIGKVRQKLKEFRENTQERLEMKSLSGVGSDIDQHYDFVFRSFLEEADEVATKLQQLMANDLKTFRYTQVGLIVLSILIFLSIGIANHRFERSRANFFRSIMEAKKKLETEIVEHKQTEEGLSISETRYRMLFERVGVSLWEEDYSEIQTMLERLKQQGVTDIPAYVREHPKFVAEAARALKVLEVNDSTLKLFHADSKEEFFGSLDKVFVPESFAVFRDELVAIAEGRESFTAEAVNGTLDGGRINVLMTVNFPAEFKTLGRLTVSIADITELKQAEQELTQHRNQLEQWVEERTKDLAAKTEQLKKSEQSLTYLLEDVNESRKQLQKVNSDYATVNNELKEFAYIVSHDLKAPLRAISQLTHWISEDYSAAFDAEGKMQMDLIIQRVKRMDGLIDGILRYSRLGRVREKAESLDLNILVKEVIDTIASGEDVKVTIENKLPVILRDSIRMEQVFQNLIGNAIKYTDKGESIIRVGCVEDETSWTFSVADNGPGIESQYHEKIFQIFQTLTPRDERESTGIGLALVKKIIGIYGGSVWLESEAGCGTTFFFTLPRKGGEDEKL
jgi:signal transduction histidine kinase